MRIHVARQTAGWTLLEMMIAVAIFSVVGGAVSSAYIFSLRSFQALSNYSVLDQQNRDAVDQLTREVRQAWAIDNYDVAYGRQLVLVDGNDVNKKITYTFNQNTKQLTRTRTGEQPTVLLRDCSLINFNLGKRVPGANYSYYPVTNNFSEAKLVDFTWKTSRTLPNKVATSENIQTARIVIRKTKVNQ